jgi:hypothetical protein
MPAAYVHQGVWHKWNGHPWTRVWTLTNFNAVIVTGLIALLFGATQFCSWIIIRHFFIRWTQPIRIEDGLDVLSQTKAAKMGLQSIHRWMFRRRRPQHSSTTQEYKYPAAIGLLALFNFLIFPIVGIFLAWFLTDGALGAPEVKSRQQPNCLDLWSGDIPEQVSNNDVALAKSTWERCNDKSSGDSYCDSGIAAANSYVTSGWPQCIFPPSICLQGHPTVAFTRANITAHDIGINSKTKITTSHRIICSPISLTPFVRNVTLPTGSAEAFGNYTISIQNPRSFNNSQDYEPLRHNEFDVNLWTDNGPHSGIEAFIRRIDSSLHLLPARPILDPGPDPYEDMHPSLKIPGTQTFVLVLKMGTSMYPSPRPIDDPLFAAHMPKQDWESYWVPDREATGIGCVEQNQVCITLPTGIKCYPWTKSIKDLPTELFVDVKRFYSNDTLDEYVRVFFRNQQSHFDQNGLQRFLRRQITLQNPPLLIRSTLMAPQRYSSVSGIDTEKQWISELAALFAKFMYWQKLETRRIIQNTIDHRNGTPASGSYLEPLSLCDMILLTDGDFTNISWIGMWVTLAVLIAVCSISCKVVFEEWKSQNKDTWNQFREDFGSDINDWRRRCRNLISTPRQDAPVGLDDLQNQPSALPEEDDPDDPLDAPEGEPPEEAPGNVIAPEAADIQHISFHSGGGRAGTW